MLIYSIEPVSKSEWPIVYISKKEIYACSMGFDENTNLRNKKYKKAFNWEVISIEEMKKIKR